MWAGLPSRKERVDRGYEMHYNQKKKKGGGADAAISQDRRRRGLVFLLLLLCLISCGRFWRKGEKTERRRRRRSLVWFAGGMVACQYEEGWHEIHRQKLFLGGNSHRKTSKSYKKEG